MNNPADLARLLGAAQPRRSSATDLLLSRGVALFLKLTTANCGCEVCAGGRQLLADFAAQLERESASSAAGGLSVRDEG